VLVGIFPIVCWTTCSWSVSQFSGRDRYAWSFKM